MLFSLTKQIASKYPFRLKAILGDSMATIQGIYVALFGRPADPTGLSYFNGVTKNGADLTAIGDLASTAEYKERFVGQTNIQIVNSIYKSLFNRDAEADGLKFFVDGLTNGTFNIKNIAIAILTAQKVRSDHCQ